MGQMQGHAPDHRSGHGFTLVELAIVLVIMGLIGTVFYNFVFSWIAKEKTNEAARTVATADKLLLGKLLGDRTGVLPAPESNPSPLDGEDGDFLPASLGLGNDPWGNRLRYFRTTEDLDTATTTDIFVRIYKDAANFATDHGAAPGGSPASSPTGQANADQLVSNVAYVVLSLGPDGRKQYRQVDGSIYIDVLQPGLESANSGGAGVNEKFDDQFSYKTLGELKNTYAAGKPLATSATAAPEGAVFSSSALEAGEAGSGTLMGTASVASDPSAPDGQVLDLTAATGDYVDLTNTAVGNATYTEYTVMGWFKTSGTSQTGDFDVITARMESGNSVNRTWWVVLWHTNSYLTQGDGTKIPGELGFKGATSVLQSGDNDFIMDTQCQDHGGAPCHHDGKWHFFCLVVRKNTALGANRYEATMYVNYTPGGVLVRMPSSEAKRYGASGDDPNGWTISNSPPKNAANYVTYIGREPGSTTRNFQGYLDEINIYEYALEESAILAYYNANKASYQ
jgi:prepilin-type N-terminal cleavage/methylation domain-containing protein